MLFYMVLICFKNQVFAVVDVSKGLVWNRDNGEIRYNDVRYLLIRPETLRDCQQTMETKNWDLGNPLFVGGLTGGRLSGQGFAEKFSLDPRQMVEFMLEMGGQIGWGRFALQELRADLLSIRVDNSPFAAGYGRTTEGVCHLIRGVFAGVAETVLGGEVIAEEQCCLAMGDSHCSFVFSKKATR